jgi:histidinol-phosphate aminotransferase
MLPFVRNDLNQLSAYTPHPGGEAGSPVSEMIIDRLDTNECPYDLPQELKQKLAWTYHHQVETNRYPDGGHLKLKQAITQYVNSNITTAESRINLNHISVGNGSDELIRSILIATCLGNEGAILVANPTFSMYGILAETLGIPVVKVGRSLDHFEMDLTAAQTAIEQTQNPPIRVVFVVHPNSPTANALTPVEINWLRQLPPDILVVIDEAYFEFGQTTLADELKHHPNWIILRTFSKAFRLAALRVGYAIAHPELVAVLEKVRLPYNLPTFSQLAAEFAMTQRELLLSVIPEILAQRDHLIDRLSNHPILKVFPSSANFIHARLKSSHSVEAADKILDEMMQFLKCQGTLIRHTGGGLRITVGTPVENQRTLERLLSLK